MRSAAGWWSHERARLRCDPPRGIIGAFLNAVAGALFTGWALPEPGVPPDNPPGIKQALWPLPGALAALGAAYWIGSRAEDGE